MFFQQKRCCLNSRKKRYPFGAKILLSCIISPWGSLFGNQETNCWQHVLTVSFQQDLLGYSSAIMKSSWSQSAHTLQQLQESTGWDFGRSSWMFSLTQCHLSPTLEASLAFFYLIAFSFCSGWDQDRVFNILCKTAFATGRYAKLSQAKDLKPDVVAFNATMTSCAQGAKWSDALHSLSLAKIKQLEGWVTGLVGILKDKGHLWKHRRFV